jgi:hypothetical protein
MENIIPSNDKWLGSNVDMICERKGKFLIAEWKRTDEKLFDGQKYLLKSLSEQKDFIVLLVNGHSKPDDIQVDTVYKVSSNTLKKVATGLDGLKDLVRTWYDYADKS